MTFPFVLYYFAVPRAQENELKLAKNIKGKKKENIFFHLKTPNKGFLHLPSKRALTVGPLWLLA